MIADITVNIKSYEEAALLFLWIMICFPIGILVGCMWSLRNWRHYYVLSVVIHAIATTIFAWNMPWNPWIKVGVAIIASLTGGVSSATSALATRKIINFLK